MSNFRFLGAQWPDLFTEAARAEHFAIGDPRTSCFYARRCAELTVSWLYDADETLTLPYRDDLAALLNEGTFVRLVGPAVRTKLDFIRRQGNIAVHRAQPVSPADAVRCVTELFHVMYWLASRYSTDPTNAPASGAAFDRELIPRPLPAEVRQRRQAELREQAEEFERQRAELAKQRRHNDDLDAELAQLRAQVKAAKAANAVRPDTHDYDEANTRTHIIDLLLREAGWPLDKPEDREFPVTGMPSPPSKTGAGKVDYVLWDDNGLPLAVVEAKRTTHDPKRGQEQAKAYADCLQAKYGQRPVIFYTNGYQTHLWDDLRYPPRPVQGFYTKDELRLVIQRRAGRLALSAMTVNPEIAGRHYQSRAIARIAETFEMDNRRSALLVMATGSGKTRVAVALVDVLARANWVKRVLFLADRKALVAQAANVFKDLLPGMPTVNMLSEPALDGRAMVCTYPTMMGLINEVDGDLRRFGPGYFDLIIIDEAHRSIYQKYGAIFDYFDALLVGLTATPKDEIDRNTYRRFELEDGVPTDAYSLDEAVAEGYLVPPRTVDVPLKFQRHGIRYDQLSEEERERWDALDWDEDDGAAPTEVSAEELNRFLFNADTVDKALKTLMINGLRVAGGDRLGKTIIFAKNQRHADFIAERFDANYPEFRGAFARVITHANPMAQKLIDDFATADKSPHIAISVDMLDTGIDVPEVVNLMFFKLVRSKTKFWQMIGRGTRLRPDLFGPNLDKTGFLVFDLCQNVEYFNQDLARAEGTLAPSLSQRLFERRTSLLLALDRQGHEPADPDIDGTRSDGGLRRDTASRLHAEVAAMNPQNVIVRPHRELVERYSDIDSWQLINPERHDEITHSLAPLPTAYRDDENSEEAKRFDLLILRLQLACLGEETAFGQLRTQVQEIAQALLNQTNIPVIAAQQELLAELAGDEWWTDVTLPMLETARRRIRGLVKLIEKVRRGVIYSDFADELGDLEFTELKGVMHGTDRSRFEAKVRTYLRSHEDQLAVQKLRRNRQITATDLAELQEIFIQSGFGMEDDIAQVAAEHDGLGPFLRSLTGLDREAASKAFDGFQAGRTLSADQLHFLNLVIDYLARNGTIDVASLYEPPFTNRAPHGPEGVFDDHDVDEIVTILRSVQQTASPRSAAS